jgi:hypothetical protein
MSELENCIGCEHNTPEQEKLLPGSCYMFRQKSPTCVRNKNRVGVKIKQVKLRLIGIDGNAFSVLGAFRRQAKKENWTSEEIDAVCDEAQTGNYAHLLVTIMKYCIGGGA